MTRYGFCAGLAIVLVVSGCSCDEDVRGEIVEYHGMTIDGALVPADPTNPDPGGGEPATVGALVFDGRTECTATVVAPSRLLTAAHCFANDRRDLSRWTFVTGRVAAHPLATYHLAEISPLGDPASHDETRDIAVVSLRESTSSVSACAVRTSATAGVLIGYGWTRTSGGVLTERGIRRSTSVSLVPSATNPVAPETGTVPCDGDSGAPILLDGYHGPVIAVHVTGRHDCGNGAALALSSSVVHWLDGLGVRCN